MDGPTFVYTTYIRHHAGAALAGAHRARVHPPLLGHAFETDWKTGSTMTWQHTASRSPTRSRSCSSPTRTAGSRYTWHTFTPELGRALGLTPTRSRERIAAEPRSKVTFDIEPVGEKVKLTVIHDGFDADSMVLS